MPTEKNSCRLTGLSEALRNFATYSGATQSQGHIKPLHWYVACRLVLEGGFSPDEITPRPPFKMYEKSVHGKKRVFLEFAPELATGGERTILGGLKTKNVDVVVVKEGIGPMIAISCKGSVGAFRNLTNRMEEAVGDCTNLHISYPVMVCGYMFVMRGYRPIHLDGEVVLAGNVDRSITKNDLAFDEKGQVVSTVYRFNSALCGLAGRKGIRDSVSKYEAVSFSIVEVEGEANGNVADSFPLTDSPLRSEYFFSDIYRHYDERYVYSAPDLEKYTRRHEWDESSPLFKESFIADSSSVLGFDLRLASDC